MIAVALIGGTILTAWLLTGVLSSSIRQLASVPASISSTVNGYKTVEAVRLQSVGKVALPQLGAYVNGHPNGALKDPANINLAKLGGAVAANSIYSTTQIINRKKKARLDKFAADLFEEPTAQGYIVVYAGRRSYPNEAQTEADIAKEYLVETRGMEPERIVTVDAGFREELTVEFWIVPQGATPPAINPTVDPTEVEIIKPPPTRRKKRTGD